MCEERVLITGGAGFIGRALVAHCLGEKNEVAVIDNLCTGRLENLAPFLDRVAYFQTDILDSAAVEAVLAKVRPSIVFHLAAHHFIPFCDQHPRETLRVNVEGTHLVLSAAARHGARVALVASSGSLYPSRDDLLSEDLEAAPVDIYGLSKSIAEQVASLIATTTGLSCVAARLFNTYGPYETNPHLIPHIMESLRRGSVVRLGNIHTCRDYIYVDDVAVLLYRCAKNCRDRYTVVNVGTGAEYSAEEIVRTASQLLGRNIKISIDDSRVRAVDKLHQRAATRRLETLTGMRPAHSLIDGLRKLLVHEGIGREESGVAPRGAESP
jgi:UDP-glucose 4-epimerase